MKKRVRTGSSVILALLLCMSCATAFANVSKQDMIDVIDSGDSEAIEKLIRTEDTPTGTWDSAELCVDESVLQPVNRDVFGLTCEVQENSGYEFLEGESEKLSEGYQKIADELYDNPVARWGGDKASLINLMYNIGPRAERKPTYCLGGLLLPGKKTGDLMNAGAAMGPVEFIKFNRAMNPNVKFIITVGLEAQTAQETLDFTHFLLDKKDESDLGAYRASLGLEEPVNLIGYELDNERYFAASWDNGYAAMSDAEKEAYDRLSAPEQLRKREAFYESVIGDYVTKSVAHITKVHEDFPEVPFYACVGKREGGREYSDYWTKGVVNGLSAKGYIAGLAYHNYYVGAIGAKGFVSELDHIQELAQSTGGKRVKFVITEHGTWDTGSPFLRKCLWSALGDATFFHDLLRRDDVICTNYYNVVGDTWQLFARYHNQYAGSAQNELLKLYADHLGEDVLNDVSSNFHKNLSAVSTRRSDGRLVIAVANAAQDMETRMQFSFSQKYKLINTKTYTAPNLYSHVYSPKDKDIFVPKKKNCNIEDFSTYTVPAESVVFLTLEKMDGGHYPAWSEDEEYHEAEPKPVEKNPEDAESDPFVSAGREPDDVIYIEKTAPFEDGRYVFPRGTTVRKIVNNGETPVEIRICNDDYAYRRLAIIPAGGTYINTLTAQEYQYIKPIGGNNISICSAVYDGFAFPDKKGLRLTARADGSDLIAPEYTLDSEKAIIVDGVLYPLDTGDVSITAEQGGKSVTQSLKIRILTQFDEDFDYADTPVVETSRATARPSMPIAGDWTLTRRSEVVNTNPTAYIKDSELCMTGCSIQGPTSEMLSYVRYNGDLSAISDNYTLSVTGRKASSTNGMGIMFHMTNEGKDYYMLWLNGLNNTHQTVWSFYKVKNEVILPEATQNGELWEDYNTDKNGPIDKESDFGITVHIKGNTISWEIAGTRYNMHPYTGGGSYTDSKFPTEKACNTKFALAVNSPGGGQSRVCKFKHITVRSDVEESPVAVIDGKEEKIAVVDTNALDENAKVLYATYRASNMTGLKTFTKEDFGGKRYKIFRLPKGTGEKNKIMVWNGANLQPICEPTEAY